MCGDTRLWRIFMRSARRGGSLLAVCASVLQYASEGENAASFTGRWGNFNLRELIYAATRAFEQR